MIFIITSQYQPYEFQEKLLSEDLLIEYFYQIISGVCALHDKGFIFPFDAILLENIFKLDAENVLLFFGRRNFGTKNLSSTGS
jgi:serine/threonine protein kinase